MLIDLPLHPPQTRSHPTGARVARAAGVEAQGFDWTTASSDEAAVELLRYQQACARELKGSMRVSLASDKAMVL